MTTTIPKRIVSEADARAWLTANGVTIPDIVDRGGVATVVESARCTRCGGLGRGPWRMDGGVCYECRGANTMNRTRSVPLVKWAQRAKREARARAKRAEQRAAQREAQAERALEGQRNWCEANTPYGRVTFAEREAIQAAEKEAAAATKQHVGTVGERRHFTVTIKAVPSWGNRYGYASTQTYCHILEDDQGNVLVWKTSAPFAIPHVGPAEWEGDWHAHSSDQDARGWRITITATVKAHDERDGVPQTIITRATLVRREWTLPARPPARLATSIAYAIAEPLAPEQSAHYRAKQAS